LVLHLLRGGFVLLATSVMLLYLLSAQFELEIGALGITLLTTAVVGSCLTIIAIDVFTRRQKLAALSGIFLGLLAGLVTAYAMSFVVDLIGLLFAPSDDEVKRKAFLNVLEGVKVFIGLITCYIGISLVMQTKDDFRFVIPYVEFSKQFRGRRPIYVDTSVLIDGRIEELAETHILTDPLIVPRFVLHELQRIADASDKLKRDRGRRGFEVLRKIQTDSRVELTIEDTAPEEGASVDHQLVHLAEAGQGRLLTNDYNLARLAEVRGIEVINLNAVARALKPRALPGETMNVTIVKPGESKDQGVGYLEDGTMVVVENGRKSIGREVSFTVTSSLQTAAGRMIFGTLETENPKNTAPEPQREKAGSPGGN